MLKCLTGYLLLGSLAIAPSMIDGRALLFSDDGKMLDQHRRPG